MYESPVLLLPRYKTGQKVSPCPVLSETDVFLQLLLFTRMEHLFQ